MVCARSEPQGGQMGLQMDAFREHPESSEAEPSDLDSDESESESDDESKSGQEEEDADGDGFEKIKCAQTPTAGKLISVASLVYAEKNSRVCGRIKMGDSRLCRSSGALTDPKHQSACPEPVNG